MCRGITASRTASLNRRRADGIQYVAAARELRRRSKAVPPGGGNMLGAVGGVGIVGIVVVVLVVLAIFYFVRRR
jgi:hypothetical protein